MFKWIDSDACTLYLYFVEDKPFVCGEIKYFSKATWIELRNKMDEMHESLIQEGFTSVFSYINKEQTNILKFEQRLGFKIIGENDENLLLVKEL